MRRFIVPAIAFLAAATPAAAQQTSSEEAARQNTVIKQAMQTYQQGLSELKEAESRLQPITNQDALRELRLEDAVSLALEKNLDIQVAKLEPQSVDFLVAGFKNQFQPVFASQVGLRDTYQLPTRTINGGTRVNQGTTTYNTSLTQEIGRASCRERREI